MPQFFVEKGLVSGREVDIRGREARHILRVLRLRAGDWLQLSDGKGRAFCAKIVSAGVSSVRALVEEEVVRSEQSPPPAVALAVAKKERFELALQKLVELGCKKIIPFFSARSVVREGEAKQKFKRWQDIALSAAKQSGLPFVPDVCKAVSFGGLFGAALGFSDIIFFYEGERETSASAVWRDNRRARDGDGLLIVGPEGGFTDEEVEFAKGRGALAVGLGPQILRVETAAITAFVIWQYELGNLDMPCR